MIDGSTIGGQINEIFLSLGTKFNLFFLRELLACEPSVWVENLNVQGIPRAGHLVLHSEQLMKPLCISGFSLAYFNN